MKAVNQYIIIENIKEGPKKVAGLIMTDDTDSDNRYLKAKIISIGNLVEGLKNGDVIYYDKHAGHDISYKEKLYRIIKSVDVVLIDNIKQ
jgi:co-chaperonin GroES (HSP10)